MALLLLRLTALAGAALLLGTAAAATPETQINNCQSYHETPQRT